MLLVVESTDVLFAVDSVPAIFGITLDPFIVFTSNIFAILGLRALYFLLAGVIEIFRYLHYGLAAVLAFVGGNMIADYFIPHQSQHLIPTWVKLLVIAGLLGVSIVASIVATKNRGIRDQGLESKVRQFTVHPSRLRLCSGLHQSSIIDSTSHETLSRHRRSGIHRQPPGRGAVGSRRPRVGGRRRIDRHVSTTWPPS